MTSVPERFAPVFSATASSTGPLPVPFAPFDTVIHDDCDAAVHTHPFCVVTSTLRAVPLYGTSLKAVGAASNVHCVGPWGGVGAGGGGAGSGNGSGRSGVGAGGGPGSGGDGGGLVVGGAGGRGGASICRTDIVCPATSTID